MAGARAPGQVYYRDALALIHHRGFAAHPEMCAPGVLRILEPVRERNGVVIELGCGSGHLTRHLVHAGHRVIATDASPAMLELAAQVVPDTQLRRLVLPDDPLPMVDAVVSVGHVLNYLPDRQTLQAALVAIARALHPGGVFALDLCDLRWGQARLDIPAQGRVGEDWAYDAGFRWYRNRSC